VGTKKFLVVDSQWSDGDKLMLRRLGNGRRLSIEAGDIDRIFQSLMDSQMRSPESGGLFAT